MTCSRCSTLESRLAAAEARAERYRLALEKEISLCPACNDGTGVLCRSPTCTRIRYALADTAAPKEETK